MEAKAAVAMDLVGDGVIEDVEDTKDAAATAMVGDGASVDGVMADLLVEDRGAPDLLTVGHPSSLRRQNMPL